MGVMNTLNRLPKLQPPNFRSMGACFVARNKHPAKHLPQCKEYPKSHGGKSDVEPRNCENAKTKTHLGVDAADHDPGVEAGAVVRLDQLPCHRLCGSHRAVERLGSKAGVWRGGVREVWGGGEFSPNFGMKPQKGVPPPQTGVCQVSYQKEGF